MTHSFCGSTIGEGRDLLSTLKRNWRVVFHFIVIFTVHTVGGVQYAESAPIVYFEKCTARSKTSLNPTIA